ncbi:hypothetical protein Zmor_025746 [Zophobas morio]|uniref:Uncharacterized protein n=1 Tax=Zophobas morio TaxID=2755281 RepID=A0AA38HSM4_9CUCU|nr:hypothetical protein Zmor_025746 [Zophobas morio]
MHLHPRCAPCRPPCVRRGFVGWGVSGNPRMPPWRTFSANFTEFTLQHSQHASLAYAPRPPITQAEETRTNERWRWKAASREVELRKRARKTGAAMGGWGWGPIVWRGRGIRRELDEHFGDILESDRWRTWLR